MPDKKRKILRLGGRSLRILYPLLLFFSLFLVFFLKKQAARRQDMQKQKLYNQAKLLLSEELNREALGVLEKIPKPLAQEEGLLYYQALLGARSYRKAFAFWKEEAEPNPKSLGRLLKLASENGKSDLAWQFFKEERKQLSEEDQQKLALPIFSDFKEYRLREAHVASWYHGNIAILENKEGMYLQDDQGKRLSQNYYQALFPAVDGFYARKGALWMLLDPRGKYVKNIDPPSKEKLEAQPPEASQVLVPYAQGGAFGYQWMEEAVTEAVYEYAGPVSPAGVAYAFSEGKWYRLSFAGLRKELISNRINRE